MTFLHNFWLIIVESAPWLLVGYFLAGIINEIIPASWVHKQLAPNTWLSVLKGAVIGAPLPLCSCGVIPAAVAIRKAGASRGATASFLVSTPETGVDSVAFSWAVLGPVYAIARPLAAVFSALTTGLLVNALHKKQESVRAASASNTAISETAISETAISETAISETAPCCSGKSGCSTSANKTVAANAKTFNVASFSAKIKAALNYGYNTMIADTAGWLLIGFIAAAAVTTWVPQSFFMQWGTGIGAMLIMVLIGLPMYICATASTPIAASFLFAGISPGAALVFLLTGPATNVATIGIVKQHLGMRSLFGYLIGVVGSAIFCGVLLDYFVQLNNWQFNKLSYDQHAHFSLWQQVLAVVLCLLVLRIFIRQGWNRFALLQP